MQVCTDTSEAVELFPSQGLYLKPVARVSISVQLPPMKSPGKSISNWEVMEKIKVMVKPDTFSMLKVTKSTLEFIRFEGEAENRACLKGIMSRLENKSIKLSGFPETLKVRAAETKIPFPTRHDWDSYFRDAKNVNEMKPGERPDTIHLENLPCRWFANPKAGSDPNKPSEYILRKVFETFGDIRLVDIPMLDPYLRDINRNNGTIQTFSFSQDLSFEAFLQYKEYISFVKAMTALKGMKLMQKEEGKCFAADMKVDFDKMKHLSDENMKKRQIERDKLIQLEKEREDRVHRERKQEERRKQEEIRRQEEEQRERDQKRADKIKKREARQREREERRRQKLLEKKKREDEEKIATKKAMDDRSKLVEQRQCEATRLLGVLLERVKEEKQKEEVDKRMQELEEERLRQLAEEQTKKATEEKLQEEAREKQRKKLEEEERLLRERLLKNLKLKREKLEEEKRERKRKEVAGKTKLRSVLIMKKEERETKRLPVQKASFGRLHSQADVTR